MKFSLEFSCNGDILRLPDKIDTLCTYAVDIFIFDKNMQNIHGVLKMCSGQKTQFIKKYKFWA